MPGHCREPTNAPSRGALGMCLCPQNRIPEAQGGKEPYAQRRPAPLPALSVLPLDLHLSRPTGPELPSEHKRVPALAVAGCLHCRPCPTPAPPRGLVMPASADEASECRDRVQHVSQRGAAQTEPLGRGVGVTSAGSPKCKGGVLQAGRTVGSRPELQAPRGLRLGEQLLGHTQLDRDKGWTVRHLRSPVFMCALRKAMSCWGRKIRIPERKLGLSQDGVYGLPCLGGRGSACKYSDRKGGLVTPGDRVGHSSCGLR